MTEFFVEALTFVRACWQWLGSHGTLAQVVVVLLAAWGLPYLARKQPALYSAWEACSDAAYRLAQLLAGDAWAAAARKAAQALPSLLIGGALGVLLEGLTWDAVWADVWALFAPLLHELAKRYRGGPTERGHVRSLGRRVGIGLLVLLLPGCTGSLQQARADGVAARQSGELQAAPAELSARCRQLDNKRTRWSAARDSLLVLTAGVAPAVIGVEHFEPSHQERYYVGLGLTAATTAAAAKYAQVMADNAAEAWAREGCGQ